MRKIIFSVALILTFLAACKKQDVNDGNTVIKITVPKGFPYPDIPSDNQPTANKIALGKMLFLDPILSRDSSISCSSCHHKDLFFTDQLQVSKGIAGRTGIRNAPSLINVAWQKSMFWDGGVPTLEQQVLAPIAAHSEMDYDVNAVVARLAAHPIYARLTKQAFGEAPSVFTLTRAIACYERTLISTRSKFDDYRYYNSTTALSESESRGMDIFFGEKGECFHCHNEYNFTSNDFRNNGLYAYYADSGRARITLLGTDVGLFKVPSLRNVSMTAPYMHDGSLSTLEQVVLHYNSGGQNHPNKSPFVKPLHLSVQDQQDLVNFLKALTDT